MKTSLKRLLCLVWCVVTITGAITFLSGIERVNALEKTEIGALDITETAVEEIGYKVQGTTKYCAWTTDTSAQRAASFISWCAYTAGVSDSIIPRISRNAELLSCFSTAGLFSTSAFLGGEKRPVVGSLIFITSNAGNYDSLSRIGIITEISGMTVSFVEDGFSDAVSVGKLSIYNTFILGYAFPDYSYSDGNKIGIYQLNEIMNFRTGPDTSYSQVKNSLGSAVQIPAGTFVTVTDINGSWGCLTYMGITGWIKLDWSKYIGESTQSPESDSEWLIVDVSQFQPESAINWTELKIAGVSGAILRIGGRYYGEASNHLLYDDKEFELHYNGAKAAGLAVGTYFFSAAYTKECAQEEAQFVLDKLNEGEYILDLPVFIDIEDINENYKPHYAAGRQVCTLVADTFCDTIEAAGYYAGIYCSKDFAEVLLEPSVFISRAVWIAQYNNECTYSGCYHMWQYTDSARFSGYNGKLDMNKCYYDLPTYIRSRGYNGFVATGENEDKWIVTVKPTCKSVGTEVIKDEDGNEIVKRYIEPLSHNTAPAVIIGKQIKAGDDVSSESGLTLIDYASYKTNAAMQSSFAAQGGSIIEYCKNCQTVIESENKPSVDCLHKTVAIKTEHESTCSVEGISVSYCTVCNNTLSSKLTALAEHNTVKVIQTATCTQAGSTTTKCKVCGIETFYRNNGLAEHSGIWTVSTPAYALVSGKEILKCTVCNKEISREIPALMICDLDKDKKVSSSDARLALRIAVNLDSADDVILSVADIDNDEKVSAADARIILRLSVKLESYSELVKKYYNITK